MKYQEFPGDKATCIFVPRACGYCTCISLQAEDFELRVTAPRREQKLQQLEEKMKLTRGFHGEGSVVGFCSEGKTGGGMSRLMEEHDEVIRRRNVEQSTNHVVRTDQSDSESEEENGEGRLITIAVKLPSKSVHKQFRTTHKIKASGNLPEAGDGHVDCTCRDNSQYYDIAVICHVSGYRPPAAADNTLYKSIIYIGHLWSTRAQENALASTLAFMIDTCIYTTLHYLTL